VNAFLETFFILAQVAVVFGFLVLVVHSKHLHIFLAPINVSTRREPAGIALGRLLPMMSNGKALDFEQADPETDTFGAGKIEDFKWTSFSIWPPAPSVAGVSRSARPGTPASR